MTKNEVHMNKAIDVIEKSINQIAEDSIDTVKKMLSMKN